MNVRDLIAHLQGLPQDAHVVVSENGLNKHLGKGIWRPHAAPASEALLDGFTAEELRREEIGLAFYETTNLVAIHLTTASDGRQVA